MLDELRARARENVRHPRWYLWSVESLAVAGVAALIDQLIHLLF